MILVCILLLGFISAPNMNAATSDDTSVNNNPPFNASDKVDAGNCIDSSNNTVGNQDVVPTTSPHSKAVTPEDSLSVHFIDVGQGDCTLITCDGHNMLIDGGNRSESSKIYSYLNVHGIDHLDYVIGTHPDSDHIGGLAGALNIASIDNAFCSTTSANNDAFANFEKYVNLQGKTITVPSVGDSFNLGSAIVNVIGPIVPSNSDNNNSIILRIDFGSTSFLFTGDAEAEEELSLLESDTQICSTVLKVAHHGSSSSCSDLFLDAVHPSYAIISVGKDNTYFHPTSSTLEKIKQRGIKLYRTDLHGTIICVSDGKNISFSVERENETGIFLPPILPETPDATFSPEIPNNRDISIDNPLQTSTAYVLNTNTMKFHYPYCSSAGKIKEKNRSEFVGTREELISLGYSPCGNCHP